MKLFVFTSSNKSFDIPRIKYKLAVDSGKVIQPVRRFVEEVRRVDLVVRRCGKSGNGKRRYEEGCVSVGRRC